MVCTIWATITSTSTIVDIDERDPTTQELTWDHARFPTGLPGLIEFIHQEGFKFGLYTSAGNVTCSSGGRSHPIPGSKGHYELDGKTLQIGESIM